VSTITWDFKRDLGSSPVRLSPDEIELLRADIQDAIDGVLEDWNLPK
jgi:hypothetical protein